MPDILRLPQRMDCRGVDLVYPVDRMQPGYFPYLFNIRVTQEGRLESRPGYTALNPASSTKFYHTVRRLNDTTQIYAPTGYFDVFGNGTELWGGQDSAPGFVDSGFSGNPLSLIPFRPENSPVAWMYVYDIAKQEKIRPDGVFRPIGVPPSGGPTDADYGTPAQVQINIGNLNTGMIVYGSATPSIGAAADRTNGSAPNTVTAILYNSGTTGWCCIQPGISSSSWVGDRMQVLLNSGGGNAETCTVREIHPAIAATTIGSVIYDAGTSGACSMVLVASPPGFARNSLISIGGEVIRVLAVIGSPDGTTYSVRCSTAGTKAAGDAVTGLISWYLYTTLTHAAAETITLLYIPIANAAIGVSSVALLTAVNAGRANGRPISEADDYYHISLYCDTPQYVTSIKIQIDVDTNTTTVGSAGNAFTKNYYTWTVTPAQLGSTWTDLVLPISEATRTGNDGSRNLSNIQAIQLTLTSVGGIVAHWGWSDWFFFGTYGAVVQPNSPVGLLYVSRNRDSSTGAASVPGPPTRYDLFPLREEVLVTPATSASPGVDSLDIYRLGGTLTTYTYVGTIPNTLGTPNVFHDTQADSTIAGNPTVDLTLIQPWPIEDIAWSGTVNVSGTSVRWLSGTTFNVNLIANTVILINGVAYQIYGQPQSSTALELTSSAGTINPATYIVSSPVLAAQKLAYVFGALEGPFAPVIFGLGDPTNAGLLYYTNASNADAAADSNTLELCPPSEPLISGAVWGGIVIVGSRDNIYLVRYSYLQTLQDNTVPGTAVYQFNRLPSASGMWSRWTCCRGPNGVYFLGRDGIYLANESGTRNITDAHLYPLFPHDGQPARVEHDLFPVDMTQTQSMRLTCCDNDILFDYIDSTGQNAVCLRYEVDKDRWFPHFYGDAISCHYLVEPTSSLPTTPEILMLSRFGGFIYQAGGNSDNGSVINCIVQTPSFDGSDERAQKLFVDAIHAFDGTGSFTVACAFDNNVTYGLTAGPYNVTGPFTQFIQNLSSLAGNNLTLYRNISAKYEWTGGPGGIRLYAFEPSGYAQPYVSTSIVTQFLNLSFVGWKHHRRLYPALISTTDVLLVIHTQDGRTFGPVTIPSTNGRYAVSPLMIPAPCKDLAFQYELTSTLPFALFPADFAIETKEWTQPEYIWLAVFRT